MIKNSCVYISGNHFIYVYITEVSDNYFVKMSSYIFEKPIPIYYLVELQKHVVLMDKIFIILVMLYQKLTL